MIPPTQLSKLVGINPSPCGANGKTLSPDELRNWGATLRWHSLLADLLVGTEVVDPVTGAPTDPGNTQYTITNNLLNYMPQRFRLTATLTKISDGGTGKAAAVPLEWSPTANANLGGWVDDTSTAFTVIDHFDYWEGVSGDEGWCRRYVHPLYGIGQGVASGAGAAIIWMEPPTAAATPTTAFADLDATLSACDNATTPINAAGFAGFPSATADIFLPAVDGSNLELAEATANDTVYNPTPFEYGNGDILQVHKHGDYWFVDRCHTWKPHWFGTGSPSSISESSSRGKVATVSSGTVTLHPNPGTGATYRLTLEGYVVVGSVSSLSQVGFTVNLITSGGTFSTKVAEDWGTVQPQSTYPFSIAAIAAIGSAGTITVTVNDDTGLAPGFTTTLRLLIEPLF